jgi:hypothetical protein
MGRPFSKLKMPHFSRTQLITTLTMMMHTVQDNSDMELNRTMALSMFEVILRYYNLFTQAKGDKKLIQTCYNKAKGPKNDPRFAKYVVKFEELTRPPPLRRSARLLKRKPLIQESV